ncbi:Ribokinase-like protein [Hesseltinella vesiculosa]|uniref:Ribokinase-like protein n=1 Tax=Hesseltinella vesiculosa TaxID=101127 RepID=A0A1X2GSM8_9FUNG|nr:Ribokinase-like protein [Hesseltinella vesiculosa]
MKPVLGSIGSLIIDDIRYRDGTEINNVIGGAGIFAIFGMRIWVQGPEARSIGYIAQRGFDHPKEIDESLASLDISLRSITHEDKHTTRGLNIFGDNDHREFEYIHPIIRTTPEDFPDDWIASMKFVHIICSTERTLEIVKAWRAREESLGKSSKTLFLWEPLPWACLADNYPNILEAGQYVDVISPNDEEAARFLGLGENGADTTVEMVETSLLRMVHDFPHATIVVRAGKKGAAVAVGENVVWVPAYWSSSEHVKDVTGAGNAFCGGFMTGWIASDSDPVLAAAYGSVASSFIIEQVGVPTLTRKTSDHLELWNSGPSPHDRLSEILDRLGLT